MLPCWYFVFSVCFHSINEKVQQFSFDRIGHCYVFLIRKTVGFLWKNCTRTVFLSLGEGWVTSCFCCRKWMAFKRRYFTVPVLLTWQPSFTNCWRSNFIFQCISNYLFRLFLLLEVKVKDIGVKFFATIELFNVLTSDSLYNRRNLQNPYIIYFYSFFLYVHSLKCSLLF